MNNERSLEKQAILLLSDGQPRTRNELAHELGSRTEWLCWTARRLLELGHVREVGRRPSKVTGGLGHVLSLTPQGIKRAARLSE